VEGGSLWCSVWGSVQAEKAEAEAGQQAEEAVKPAGIGVAGRQSAVCGVCSAVCVLCLWRRCGVGNRGVVVCVCGVVWWGRVCV